MAGIFEIVTSSWQHRASIGIGVEKYIYIYILDRRQWKRDVAKLIKISNRPAEHTLVPQQSEKRGEKTFLFVFCFLFGLFTQLHAAELVPSR